MLLDSLLHRADFKRFNRVLLHSVVLEKFTALVQKLFNVEAEVGRVCLLVVTVN